jgi:hypothetical protein
MRRTPAVAPWPCTTIDRAFSVETMGRRRRVCSIGDAASRQCVCVLRQGNVVRTSEAQAVEEGEVQVLRHILLSCIHACVDWGVMRVGARPSAWALPGKNARRGRPCLFCT